MLTLFSNMQNAEEFRLPNVLRIGSYYVYFWTNENTEPVHVHISTGKPVPDSTKLWLTKSGHCIVANNNSQIPDHKLNKLIEIIEDQFFYICNKWVETFGKDTLKFYC